VDGPAGDAAGSHDAASHDAAADHSVASSDGGGIISTAPIALGNVSCGASGTATLPIAGSGTSGLVVTASTTGLGFSVSPTSLDVTAGSADGGQATLTITATVPGSATAGSTLTGSLNLFTNDPQQSSIVIPLSAVATGATIVTASGSPTSAAFPETAAGTTASQIALWLVNEGNAAATVTLSNPSNAEFALYGQASATLAPCVGSSCESLAVSAGFSPTVGSASTAGVATVSISGVTCGTSLSQIAFSGTVGYGVVSGWPSAPIDFGAGECGGAAPAPQSFTLSNTGVADATVTEATIDTAGFTSTLQGATIPAGGTFTAVVTPPSVPSLSTLTPITATLTVETTADTAPHTITLTEEPAGAVLAFDTSSTQNFGSFGQIVLLQTASQSFSVTNSGTAAATVTLGTGVAPENGALPFTVSNGSFTLSGGSTQSDSVVFSPTAAGTNGAPLTLTASGPVCAALPSALPLAGFGIGGGPSVTPMSLSFGAPCGGSAPAAQSFTVSNVGTANMNWSMSAVTGSGSAQYHVSATPPPGLLAPNATSLVTVTAAAIPSPAPSLLPSAYAAQLTVTTDVPYDPPHMVTLGETPLGDQLSVSQGSLRFGQFPVDAITIPLTFTVSNGANAGSPAADFTFIVAGTEASFYTVGPTSVGNLAPGAVSSAEDVIFAPLSTTPAPATVSLSTSDALCTPLPSPIQLSGTGTQGRVAVSQVEMAFGTDPRDPNGLVNCGATGLAHTFTISNVGNEEFDVTGLTLGQGSASPYTLSGYASLPAEVPIGGSLTVAVTPSAIPATVSNPNDPNAFADTVTVVTDALNDQPHTITLHMQPRGAVIASGGLATTWSFGTIGGGAIGTYENAITNTGNAPVSIAMTGLNQPSIFGLQTNPTIAPGNAVTTVVGTFSPPSSDGQWTDQGTIVVTATQALCEPLPTTWASPVISVSGASNSNPPVTLFGNLAFPTTDCGEAAPGAQAIKLTNNTDQDLPFSTGFNVGTFYTLQTASLVPVDAGADAATADGGPVLVLETDGGTGIVPANGAAILQVAPKTVTPGAGVQAGSAAYADDLLVSVNSTPGVSFTIPISWSLNGAVFSLPLGQGTSTDSSGKPFYPADTESEYTLPIVNSGTGTASVNFTIAPTAAFSISPTPPVSVEPGVEAFPLLNASTSDAVCPALTPGTATFFYSGPVCQPFPYTQINIESCVGAY
jgi:hypothetical protein